MRAQPRAWVGLAAWLLYVVVIVVIQATSGISYTDFGDSAGNLWRGAVISLVVGAVVVAVVTTWLGWWRPAIRERRRDQGEVDDHRSCSARRGPGRGTWRERLEAVGADFVIAALVLGVCSSGSTRR